MQTRVNKHCNTKLYKNKEIEMTKQKHTKCVTALFPYPHSRREFMSFLGRRKKQ